jgi:tRNA (adenine57-N1/adenine58-N1)-methyltransferase
VEGFFSGPHPAWQLRTGDLAAELTQDPVDRAVLDMLAPWECVDPLGSVLEPGGVLAAYVATTTQLSRMVETVRSHGGFSEPEATESLVRAWHAEGLAVRPRHDMVGHTGFVIISRRLAPGQTAPPRKRRPAPGAYGEDYPGLGADPGSVLSEEVPHVGTDA